MVLELLVTAVTLAASPDTTLPGTPVIGATQDVPWPVGDGVLDFGVKTTSDSYTDGHFSVTAPLFSNLGRDGKLGGSIAFIEPYISWGEQGEVAVSLGLGFRHLCSSQPLSALQERHTGPLDEGIMVGGNLFLDMLDTTSNNRFWQLGAGLEFETRYFALRGNYYQPLTGRKEGKPYLDRTVQRGELITDGKEPFAQGHTIQQDVTFTTFDFYTDRLYRYYEEGMEGWDIEAAMLVPGLDKWCELWLIGGYGDFRNKPFGPQMGGTGEMRGWKAGVEFRPIPQLVLSAMHFDEKRMQGGEWMYGLSLQLPLDPEPGNKDKSWWRKLRDTLKPRSRHLAERAAVPVHRQNAAVKIANSISEPEVKTYAKTVSSEERRVVVRDDVMFVNNGGAQGNGIAAHGAVEDGTAEKPFDTIAEGSYLAGTRRYQSQGVPTVYVAGGGQPYGEVIDAGWKSVHYASGGFGVECYAGHRFGFGIPASIAPPLFEDYAVVSGSTPLASPLPPQSFWLDGFNIQSRGVNVLATDVRIRGNQIFMGTGQGAAVDVAAFNADISSNTIFAQEGIRVVTGNRSGNGRIAITNNLVVNSIPGAFEFGIDLEAVVYSKHFVEADISGNTIVGFATPIILNNDVPGFPTVRVHVSSSETNFVPGFINPWSTISTGLNAFGAVEINGVIVRFP